MIGWDDRPFKPSDYHFLQGVPTRCVSSPEKLGPPGGIQSVSAHDHVHASGPLLLQQSLVLDVLLLHEQKYCWMPGAAPMLAPEV